MKRLVSAAIAGSALGLLALGAAGGATSVHAAEYADWSGPYLGAQAGYSFGDNNGHLTDPFFAKESDFYNSRPEGLVGGVHAGWNFQFGQFVIGPEADVEAAAISGSATVSQPGFQPYTFKTTSDFDFSLRLRAGYAFDQFLLYATGGAAWGQVQTTYSCPVCSGPGGVFDTADSIRLGWTAGAGVQYALTPATSVGLEYRYTDLGSKSFTDPNEATADRSGYTSNAIRFRMSFRFPAPPPPAVAPAPAPQPVAAPAPAPAPAPRLFIVFFDFDKYNLTPDARKVVEEAASTYKSGGSAKVTLAGYTDLSGPAGYNMKLSERRAKTVAAAMVKLGVPESAMDVSWHGKENPRVPTPDGVREPQNRRVEITE